MSYLSNGGTQAFAAVARTAETPEYIKAKTKETVAICCSYPEAVKRAEEKGLVVRHPKANELFLDIDTPEQFAVFTRNVEVLKKFKPVKAVIDDPSSSGAPGRRHVTVVLEEDITKVERVAFQAALGSDPMREMLSLARIAVNDAHPTLFFERPA